MINIIKNFYYSFPTPWLLWGLCFSFPLFDQKKAKTAIGLSLFVWRS